MKAFAVFAAILAAASANPQIIYNSGLGLGYHGLTYAAAPAVVAAPVAVPAVTKTQYHAQDELGQASFGHAEPGQAHAAVRDAAGGVRGSFSYVAPDGRVLTTNYIADHNGYRVASNALPVAPSAVLAGPLPVADTPEVVAAKVQHFAAVAEAQARSGRKKRGIINYAAPTVYSSSVVHTPALTYAAAPAITYAAAPAVHTYAAAPAVHTYAAAPALTYAAAPAVTYAAAPAVVAANPLREATLTKVVNTPGHAVSYRVD